MLNERIWDRCRNFQCVSKNLGILYKNEIDDCVFNFSEIGLLK